MKVSSAYRLSKLVLPAPLSPMNTSFTSTVGLFYSFGFRFAIDIDIDIGVILAL